MAGVWTKNFQAFKNIWLCGDANYALSCLKDSDGNLRWTVSDTENYHGRSYSPPSPMGRVIVGTDYNAAAYGKIYLGSGSAMPAATDYKLTEELSGISYLSAVNEKPVWNTSTGEVSNTVKLTVQNTSAEAITIREWGLFLRQPFYRDSSSNVTHLYLIYHATLDTPVTLAANQSATLTLTRSVTLTDPVVWPE